MMFLLLSESASRPLSDSQFQLTSYDVKAQEMELYAGDQRIGIL